MTGRLRVGVLGAGAWSVASHLPNLSLRSDEIELVGVSRLDEVGLRAVQRRFGFEVASTDYRDILALDLDLCVVAGPASTHFEHAMAALESGAHILVEKPFTLVPEDAWALVSAAANYSRHLVVAFGYNYLPMSLSANSLLHGELSVGEIEHVSVVMSTTFRSGLLGSEMPQFGSGVDAQAAATQQSFDPLLRSNASTLQDPTLSGGGYAQGQLSHALGLISWLTQLRGSSAFALTSDVSDGMDLHDAIAVAFEGGAIGAVSGSSHHWGFNDNRDVFEVRVIGQHGQLLLDFGRDLVCLYRPGSGEVRPRFPAGAGKYHCAGPLNAIVDLAAGRIVENNSSGVIGARAVELVSAIYASSASGQLEGI